MIKQVAKPADVYCVTAEWRAQAGQEKTVAQLLLKIVAAVEQHEPGNLQYTAHQDPVEPGHFFLYEQYINKAAFEAHRKTAHYEEIVISQIVPLLSERKVFFYHPLV
ncbi:putative quinol monooxygenase [Hymenobacter sp.]|jgi:quinol monooxygenase YgiN|uniref:putative quinol monooxygenase n=1 Tax=Hymenobacter sp. TaxID=1898978 RepID=UPI002ED833A1